MSDVAGPPPPPGPPPYVARPDAPAAPAHRAPAPARRSSALLVAAVASVSVVLLALVLGGGYVLGGNLVTSSRIASAESTIASIHKIDFSARMGDVEGAFNPYGFASMSAAKAFQASVQQFVTAIGADGTEIPAEAVKVRLARSRLDDSAWLMLLNQGRRDAAATRLGHAQKALDAAATIAGDLQKDGAFFQAYAAAAIDFQNYAAAVDANDANGEGAPIEKAKSDLALALGLVDGPGLPPALRGYIAAIQTVAADIIKAMLAPDDATYKADIRQLTSDEDAVTNIDTSGFDASIYEFYQPMIGAYDRELQRASD